MKSLLTLSFVLAATPLWPQASTSSVRGTVMDQTNSAVPTAMVTLINQGTSVEVKTTTNEVGFYVFASVIPGPYRIKAEASGFQTFEGTLTVQVAQVAVVNPTLTVGQTATQVEVVDVGSGFGPGDQHAAVVGAKVEGREHALRVRAQFWALVGRGAESLAGLLLLALGHQK